jgi:hypothetical protein
MLTSNQEQLVYWITERESIRKKKEAGLPAPWSDNPVMQETYFCNVNREDDKVTKWIRENWTYPTSSDFDLLGEDTSQVYDFAMVIARIFNLPATLEELKQPVGEDFDLYIWLEHAEQVLHERKQRGENVWNGAYIISTNGKKMDKASYCLMLLEKLANSPKVTHNCSTLHEAHLALMKVEGLASFLAAQVVADLKNTKDHPLSKAEDWFTFSAPGPGSLRGLSWFFEEKVSAKNYHAKIKEAYEILEFELPEEILDFLCFQNLQNCFCEYDKFMRVTNGTGRSKRKYKGK